VQGSGDQLPTFQLQSMVPEQGISHNWCAIIYARNDKALCGDSSPPKKTWQSALDTHVQHSATNHSTTSKREQSHSVSEAQHLKRLIEFTEAMHKVQEQAMRAA
jgi:hypothetical protein